MSKLDKDKVLEEFSAAYKKAHGKAPKVEDANGWYSVDDGKNLRLAQLDEWRQELESGGSKTTSQADKSESAKKPAKKPAKSSTKAKKSKSSASSGVTAKELWRQKLEQNASDCRLPRGFPAE